MLCSCAKSNTEAAAVYDIPAPQGYKLVWHDEFDADTLILQDWVYENKPAHWVNNELQTYIPVGIDGIPVVEINDGVLAINCFKHNDTIYSGRIYAHPHEGWQYGIFEARLKLPKGRGTWPAFWMMPAWNNNEEHGWPACGEIDIMEEVGFNPNYTSSSIHCKDYNHVMGTQKTFERLCEGAEDDFHVYRLEWEPEYLKTYVDDELLFTFENDGEGNYATWPFNKPFYLILNFAWGGGWGGAQGVDETALPQSYLVDYVRVFQKE